jgi:hypothetical protein
MNALIYNVALVVGLVLVGVGIGLQCGVASALVVVGLLVLILSMFTAHIASRG